MIGKLLQLLVPSDTTWDVHFSPKGGCEAFIVDAIGKAAKTVLVQAYSFTNDAIADALVNAKRRGVEVRVIVDLKESVENGSAFPRLQAAGVEMWTDGAHPIAHNKVMVIDSLVVLTGSFNYTNQAEHLNAENLLHVVDPDLAKKYSDNWEVHRQHSVLVAQIPKVNV
jgi:phosphatidylserine/phosphatidylglycerophosphate/cardiolipin synthase-like enzyme